MASLINLTVPINTFNLNSILPIFIMTLAFCRLQLPEISSFTPLFILCYWDLHISNKTSAAELRLINTIIKPELFNRKINTFKNIIFFCTLLYYCVLTTYVTCLLALLNACICIFLDYV